MNERAPNTAKNSEQVSGQHPWAAHPGDALPGATTEPSDPRILKLLHCHTHTALSLSVSARFVLDPLVQPLRGDPRSLP